MELQKSAPRRSYRAVLAELLSESLHMMSLDLVKMVDGYVGCPTATTGATPELLFVMNDTDSFSGTSALACDRDNRIWVAHVQHVYIYSPEGEFIRRVCSSTNAASIAFGPSGEAYIADFHTGCVQVCRPDGNYLRHFGPKTFFRPSLLMVDCKQELLFVFEHPDRRLHVMNLDGKDVRVMDGLGAGKGHFSGPNTMAIHTLDQELGVLDNTFCGIQVFDYKGKSLRRFASHGLVPVFESFAVGLAVDSVGNWVVVHQGNFDDPVQVFASDGRFLTAFGHQIPESLHSVCVDREGRILIGTAWKVYVFTFDVSTRTDE